MKKKLISLLLAAAMVLSLAPAAFALGAFADVTDAETAQNVEVLRLLGVLEGDGNGAFRPYGSLTRAEFCKMAVVLTGKRGAVASYARRDVGFSDMRSSHWAAGYVNYAASKEVGLIHGMPDGTFAPDRPITYGEAAAILTRLLGYTDKDAGGIWPDGYLALAAQTGLSRGLNIAGGAAITRAQAAKLFVNALSSEDDKGVKLLSLLGYSEGKDETVLYSIDLANGKMRTQEGNYDLAEPRSSNALNGLKGRVLLNADGKAASFLPSAGTSGAALSDAAIVVSANGSTAGFDVLTGGATGYSVYRNGILTTTDGLKKNDVVIYSAASNAVLACDTRVNVYYENCAPSPAAPNTVTVLGGTEFNVLPTAHQSLSAFKPGQEMTLLLTADGRVAGAANSDANVRAYAYVSGGGKVSLLCGDSLIPLNAAASDKLEMDVSKVLGDVVRISQTGSATKSTIFLSGQSGVSGNLDVTRKTLGAYKVADGALVFYGGELTSLAALDMSLVPEGRIAFARSDNAREVDLIVIKDNTGEYYGRVTVRTQREGSLPVQYIRVSVSNSAGDDVEKQSYINVRTGDFVSYEYNSKDEFINMAPMTRLENVSAAAWLSEDVLNYGDQTYVVSDRVICYNRDSGSWFDSLDAAKAYGGRMDLYAKDGMIHAVEVRS